MIHQLLCGCCSNGCACPTHAADRKRAVCLSHRLSTEQQKTGQYMIDLEIEDHAERDARQARDFQRDHEEELDGTYR